MKQNVKKLVKESRTESTKVCKHPGFVYFYRSMMLESLRNAVLKANTVFEASKVFCGSRKSAPNSFIIVIMLGSCVDFSLKIILNVIFMIIVTFII